MTSFFATIPQMGARSRGHHSGGPLFVFPAPGPQTSRVRHCILDAPLPADNIGRQTYRLGSFYEPNMTFKLTTSCARNQIQSPFIQIACHEDNTARKPQLVVKRIFSIICAFKKKKTVPAEGWQHGHSTESKNCVFVFTSVISRVGRRKKKNVMKEVMWLIGGWEKH